MTTHQIENQLVTLCKKYTLADTSSVVVPEPYLPYIPRDWNGYLILAEAQNLSQTYDGYVKWLQSSSPEARFKRLNNFDSSIGVRPWDDGTLKFAIKACWPEINIERIGVSNAVLWSQREGRTNKKPSEQLQNFSANFWAEMFELLKPTKLVTVGAVASFVLKKTGRSDFIEWTSASSSLLSRVSNLFGKKGDNGDYLLSKFQKVNAAHAFVVNNQLDWLNQFKKNKIFFACHAVSLTVS